MQQTYQDRLTIDSTQQRWMGAFGSLYGDLQRKLYMHASTGERLNDLKSDFCRENGISARHFNALRMELEGKISGTVELLKVRKKDIVRALGKTERTLKWTPESGQT